jgi:hypothetical protein
MKMQHWALRESHAHLNKKAKCVFKDGVGKFCVTRSDDVNSVRVQLHYFY